MKKLVLTATLTLACVAAFAQGKVAFKNDSLHLIYYTTDTRSLLLTDQALAGHVVPLGGGGTLIAELWAGTSAASLAKVSSTSIAGGTAGTFGPLNTILPSGLAGAPNVTTFQVKVYDSTAGSYAAASVAQNTYYGASSVFTAVASSGTAYFSLVQLIAPASSSWAIGTVDVGSSYGAAGAMGAIGLVANVPEPTTMALAGLGAAALLIFRRRK